MRAVHRNASVELCKSSKLVPLHKINPDVQMRKLNLLGKFGKKHNNICGKLTF